MGAVSMPLEHISASESEPFLDSREHESLVVRSNPYGIAPQRIRLLPIPLDRIRQVNCIRLQLTSRAGNKIGPNSTVVVGAAFASTTGVTLLAFFLLLAAILVSFSRVYIGTHYISDIMGGALTGIFAAIIVKTLYKPETRVDRFITSIL